MVRINRLPFLENAHCIAPVSTWITSSSSVTAIASPFASEGDVPSRKVSDAGVSPPPKAAAWADHFTDPSAHRAVTQCWAFTEVPSWATKASFSVLFNTPLAHGTPHVTPRFVFGACPPSQCRSATDSLCSAGPHGRTDIVPTNGTAEANNADCFKNCRLDC